MTSLLESGGDVARVCLRPPEAAGGLGTPSVTVSNKLPAEFQAVSPPNLHVRVQVGGDLSRSAKYSVGGA